MKKILLILFAFCTLMGAVKAQEDATISPDQIEYWIGEGMNLLWCGSDAGFMAMGVRDTVKRVQAL